MPIYNGRTRISDENIWRVVDIKTTTVTSALYESLEENIQEDLQIGDFVLEITEVNQYISDDDVLDNKINNINVPNGEIRKTYAVILSKENYNKLQYLTGFTTNTSYSTLGSLRNDIDNLETNIVYLIRNNDKYDEYILAGSGNNKELVKIGDTSVTFDSSNLVDLSEFLQLRTDLKQSHDELSNRISSNATNISENTNNIQNLTNETLSIKNNLNNVEADMTTVKKEVWGSNTTTGDSRIDILEETTQKKERTEIDYLNMGTTTDPGYYNVVNQNGNGFSITYKTSENGASSTIENITKAPMDVYSAILNGVSYVMQRIIIGDKTYTRYLNVSSNTTSPWMAEPVVTNTVTNTPNKIPTSQAVVDYVPTNISSFNNDSGYLTAHQDISGKEDKSNKVTSLSSSSTDTEYPSAKAVFTNMGILYNDMNNNMDGKISQLGMTLSSVATSGSYNDLKNKPAIPSASSTTPSADTQDGSVGTGTTWARSDHTHPKSSLYAEASHNHSQYLTSHQSLEDYIQKSSTTGLIKNDGTIDTNTYATTSSVGTAMTNLGNNVNTGLSTVNNRISNLNTSNIISSGESLNNIGSYSGTVPQSTINSGINTQLGTINTKLGTINTKLGTINTKISSSKHILEATRALDGSRVNLTINLSYLTTITDPSVDFSPLYVKLPNDMASTTGGVRFIIKYNNGNSTFPTQQLYDMNGSSGIRENVLSANEIIIIGWDSNKLKLLKILGKEYSAVAETGSYNDLSDKPTIVDNLTTNDATKVLSAKQGKMLNDLIGDAITYINGTGGS